MAFFLVSAVFGTCINPAAPRLGGLGIGLALMFDILVGGPLTGAAVNPARAFGPALISGQWVAHVGVLGRADRGRGAGGAGVGACAAAEGSEGVRERVTLSAVKGTMPAWSPSLRSG